MIDWVVVFPQRLFTQLRDHLFPGDGLPHGAVIAAGVARSLNGDGRLLVREVVPARDGIEYIPGTRGHHALKADFIADQIEHCRDEKLAYLAVHCHGGYDAVEFSPTDWSSHERGYPALVDIGRGVIVGALVFAEDAVAGDLWLPDGTRARVRETHVLGRNIRRLYPEPPARPPRRDERYDRQARLFGDRGQALLSSITVGVIGAGGVGSLVVEQLARLGVGHLLIVDPDRIELSNLSRVVGATRWDARGWFASEDRPAWIRTLARRASTPKVKIAERVARDANPGITVETIFGDFTEDVIARRFIGCDYLFLAANSHLARLVFNAIVHQYYVPGVQVGTKIPVDKETGAIGEIFSTARSVTPGEGCLDCNGYISAQKLEEESLPAAVLRRQRYVDGDDVPAPSVVTLNATAVGWATNDFLMTMLELHRDEGAHAYVRFLPRVDDIAIEEVRRDSACTECGVGGRLGWGDTRTLPARRRVKST